MRRLQPILASVVIVGGLAIGQNAHAWVTWEFVNTQNCVSAGCGGWDNSRTYTPDSGSGPNVTVTAYTSYVDNGTTFDFQSGKVTAFSGGLGASLEYGSGGPYETNPQHGIDNVRNSLDPGWVDFAQDAVMFDFGGSSLVALDYMDAGWFQNDADVDLYAWEGPGSAGALTSTSPDDLVADGWTQVTGGTIYNIENGASFNTTHAVKASQWVVVASLAGSYQADYFKLKTLKGKTFTPPPPPNTGVPVPAPLALVGGMLGLMGLQRKFRS